MTEKLNKINISELTLGMYVISIVNPNKQVNVKSEGFISSQATITKLRKLGIKQLFIDPSKTKKSPLVAGKESTNDTSEKKTTEDIYKSSHSFNAEITKAKSLFSDAKSLQKKLLSDISKDKQIDMQSINNTTNAIVDSVFRNQDALSCMARLRIKDEYLIEHSLNVSILISIFAKHLRIEKNIIEQLALGAFLHDVGKIKIPDRILNKPGRFTDDEYEIMKRHVEYGVEIISQETDISPIALDIIHQHHERLDGQGYPNKLANDEINLYARMIAIVDSYDAMTADRVYKKGMSPIKAFKILSAGAEKSYDKSLVEQFIQCLGVYPIGTLVKLTSGKLGLISQLNKSKPLNPFVKVFYNTRLNQAVAITEVDLSLPKHQDQIDSCIRPEDFKLNLLGFFNMALTD
jgi:putative nucleotidyltransferase with HDIG domain